MKRKWEVQRTPVKRLDGQRRWDIAYQRLLHWTNEITAVSDEGTATLMTQEVKNESCPLCPGLDLTATTEPNH